MPWHGLLDLSGMASYCTVGEYRTVEYFKAVKCGAVWGLHCEVQLWGAVYLLPEEGGWFIICYGFTFGNLYSLTAGLSDWTNPLEQKS